MSSIPYKIDPVKATCMKYAGQSKGIQKLNDTCFNVCASYSGTYDTFEMDPACTKACEDFIEKRRIEIFGVGSCDHQVPYRPVAWDAYPSYFPQLLRKGHSPNNALKECKRLCSVNAVNRVEDCQETCETDFYALVLDDNKSVPVETKEGFDDENVQLHHQAPLEAPSSHLAQAPSSPMKETATQSSRSNSSRVTAIVVAMVIAVILIYAWYNFKNRK